MNLQKTLQTNDNLDSYMSEGVYTCQTKAISDTIVNKPDVISTGFKLLVVPVSAKLYGIQIIIPANSSNLVCKRCFIAGSWGAWYCENLSSLTTKAKDSLVSAVNSIYCGEIAANEYLYNSDEANAVLDKLYNNMMAASTATGTFLAKPFEASSAVRWRMEILKSSVTYGYIRIISYSGNNDLSEHVRRLYNAEWSWIS